MNPTKPIPFDAGAEAAVIGSMIVDAACIDEAVKTLDRDAFYLPENKLIFDAILALHKAGQGIDGLLVRRELEDRQKLVNIGGADYLQRVIDSVPSSANVGHYAKIVRNCHLRRQTIEAANRIMEAAYDVGVNINDTLSDTRETLDLLCAGPGRREDVTQPVLQRMADVKPVALDWLWPGRIPMGRITLLVGRPGEGKSFLTTYMASRVSTGSPWPDGASCPHGSVILICAEDGAGDTIRPRLDAHWADVQQIHLLSMVRHVGHDGQCTEIMFTLADLPALEAALKAVADCKLIVVDPIGSFMGGRTDTYRDNEVRSVLAPVAALAERYGPAVVVVAHRRKGSGDSADDLALGSRAFTGIARVVWHVTRDSDNRDRRLLLAGKNNLAREGDGLAFSIDGEPPAICWEREPVKMSADEAMSEVGDDDQGATGEAAEWLRSLLADGRVRSAEIKATAKRDSIAWSTVKRAKRKIKADAVRVGVGAAGVWYWQLPGTGQASKEAQGDQE